VAATLLAATFAGCGGGGGDTPTVAAKDTSIAQASAPANFGFANVRPVTRTGRQLLDAVGGFPVTDVRRTWVSLWYVDAAGARRQLAFMSLAALQSLDAAGGVTVSVPGGVTGIGYEIYDATTSRTGEALA